MVSLSATVSNAEEFGGWIQTVRGDTTVVVDEHRPVPLWQHILVGKRLFDLFDYRKSEADERRPPSRAARQSGPVAPHRAPPRGGPAVGLAAPPAGGTRTLAALGRPRFYRPPARPDVIAILDSEGLLPAITFVFSRAGCDAAVQQCLRSPLRLTTEEERAQIAEVIEHRCGDLADSDLAVLGYYEWREGLLRGLAAHHAGMLPVVPAHRRGAVHRRPGQGGVRHRNPGARHQHARPHGGARTAGEVQRRAARAADAGGVHAADRPRRAARHRRRGPRGGALESRRRNHRTVRGRRPGVHPHLPAAQFVRPVVQHDDQPGAPDGPRAGASAAGAVVRPVSGRPVRRRPGPRHRARQADARRDRSRAGRTARRRSSNTPGCARGSPNWSARSPARRGCSGGRRPAMRWPRCVEATSSTSPTAGAAGWRWCWNRPATATTRARWCSPKTAGRGGFRRPTIRVRRRRSVRCRCPSGSSTASRESGAIWRRRCGRRPPGWPFRPGAAAAAATETARSTTRSWRRCGRSCVGIPSHSSPGLESQVRQAERYLRIERDNAQLEKKVAAATNSLARTFDRIVGLLTERGFIQGPDTDPHVTDDGRLLARIYSESDLLVAECLRTGAWAGSEAGRVGGGGLGGALREHEVVTARGTAFAAEAPTQRLRQALQQTSTAVDCAARRRADAPDRARVVNPTTVSSTSSTAGPGPETWPRRWRPSTRRAAARRCWRAISCAGAGRCSICWTRSATPPRMLSCGPPPSAPSMTFGAASSQLTPGRLGRSYRRSGNHNADSSCQDTRG